jgi:hypothetical protein
MVPTCHQSAFLWGHTCGTTARPGKAASIFAERKIDNHFWTTLAALSKAPEPMQSYTGCRSDNAENYSKVAKSHVGIAS